MSADVVYEIARYGGEGATHCCWSGYSCVRQPGNF